MRGIIPDRNPVKILRLELSGVRHPLVSVCLGCGDLKVAGIGELEYEKRVTYSTPDSSS